MKRALSYVKKFDASLEELVLQTRRRLASLRLEVCRIAEVLDAQGDLVGVDIIKSVARLLPAEWLQ